MSSYIGFIGVYILQDWPLAFTVLPLGQNSTPKWLVLAFAFFLLFSSTRTALSTQSVY